MQNARAGIKIVGRKISNLRYAYDTILMAERRGIKEPLDEDERGEWKSWLKTQCSKDEDHGIQFHQFSSVAQSCLTLCNLMDYSTPGFPVHHQHSELTHVHQVSAAIQPSHPLLSPSPHAFSLSQHQGLFQEVSSLNQVAKVLEFQLQHQSLQ